ncbi:MAG: phosphodiester glycosidase family protein [Rubrivivax sp.]
MRARTWIFAGLLAEALVVAAQAQPLPEAAWQPRFTGVETARIELEQPRKLVLHVARVDLRARGLRWFATPPALPGSAPLAPPGRHTGETLGQFTSSFLRTHGLQLAINAAPFGPVVDEEGTLLDVAGLQVSLGRLVSGQTKDYPALMILADGRARLARPPFDLAGVVNAVGGFDIVLERGVPLFRPPAEGARPPALHPRTAVGLADDGWRAWVVVVDGRQEGYSLGVALYELAVLLRALGATDGINLDGGGTSTLVVQGPDTQPLVLNRPIHRGEPGRERVSASHLGLWALPLSAQAPAPAASGPPR